MTEHEHSLPVEPKHRGRWAWKVASIAGISIYIHATFVMLLAWVAMSHFAAGHDLALASRGLLLIGSVFAIVVLHEAAPFGAT